MARKYQITAEIKKRLARMGNNQINYKIKNDRG